MFSFGSKKSNRRREGKAAVARRPRLDFGFFGRVHKAAHHRSLDLSPQGYSTQSSFRIGGSIEGEVEHLNRSLGLSGPEDFAIPIAAWEASLKFRSSSDILPRSRLLDSEDTASVSDLPEGVRVEAAPVGGEVGVRAPPAVLVEIRVGDEESAEVLNDGGNTSDRLPVLSSPIARSVLVPAISVTLPVAAVITGEIEVGAVAEAAVLGEEIRVWEEEAAVIRRSSAGRSGRSDVGIKGTRPPVLTPPPPVSVLSPPPVRSVLPPPPSMKLPVHDRASSSWEIMRSFAPADENEVADGRRSLDSDEREDEEDDDESVGSGGGVGEVLQRAVMEGETSDGIGSFSTFVVVDDDSSSNTTFFVVDDDSSSTTTFVVIDDDSSSTTTFKKQIGSWVRGHHLGSGSFGTVYKALIDDGTFIAVKEVSLIDKGSNAQQCILQLEQEIALLSQFEHENIVQYYGTAKEESKLFIFLELVTQGSLASLYNDYHLRDTQVSLYTRQILNGLNYLHERGVVHRDIKCANILVHANGSIKLADFGLAKQMSELNDLKSCKGSVYWMAPEVVNPRKTYGLAADIWSLGCTVLEMLTRQIPYPNVEWQHAFYRIGRGDKPPIPSQLSSDAQDFIRKCVQVDPITRPSAAQLLGHPFVMKRPLETY